MAILITPRKVAVLVYSQPDPFAALRAKIQSLRARLALAIRNGS